MLNRLHPWRGEGQVFHRRKVLQVNLLDVADSEVG
jgi:hypothetical protein